MEEQFARQQASGTAQAMQIPLAFLAATATPATAALCVLLHNGPSSHFLGAFAVPAGALSRAFDVFVLPLLF